MNSYQMTLVYINITLIVPTDILHITRLVSTDWNLGLNFRVFVANFSNQFFRSELVIKPFQQVSGQEKKTYTYETVGRINEKNEYGVCHIKNSCVWCQHTVPYLHCELTPISTAKSKWCCRAYSNCKWHYIRSFLHNHWVDQSWNVSIFKTGLAIGSRNWINFAF